MFAVASGSETPVCRKTRASKLAKDLPSPSNYWSTGYGRGNTIREITLPRSMEAYFQKYLDHCLGVAPTVKQKDNVVSKISRIKNLGADWDYSPVLSTGPLRYCRPTSVPLLNYHYYRYYNYYYCTVHFQYTTVRSKWTPCGSLWTRRAARFRPQLGLSSDS